jgi:hypothetical protein
MKVIRIVLLAIAIGVFAAWAADKVSGLSNNVQPAAQVSEQRIVNPQQPSGNALEATPSTLNVGLDVQPQ